MILSLINSCFLPSDDLILPLGFYVCHILCVFFIPWSSSKLTLTGCQLDQDNGLLLVTIQSLQVQPLALRFYKQLPEESSLCPSLVMHSSAPSVPTVLWCLYFCIKGILLWLVFKVHKISKFIFHYQSTCTQGSQSNDL